MRAVRVERDGSIRLVQDANPQPGPEDVLVLARTVEEALKAVLEIPSESVLTEVF